MQLYIGYDYQIVFIRTCRPTFSVYTEVEGMATLQLRKWISTTFGRLIALLPRQSVSVNHKSYTVYNRKSY